MDPNNRSQANKKTGNIQSSYSIDTADQRKKESGILNKIDVFLEEIDYRNYLKNKKKKKLKDLGLHEDFDPSKTYDMKSREVAIKTWKDFFVVYIVMAFVIYVLIWFLVRGGYISDPIENIKEVLNIDTDVHQNDELIEPVNKDDVSETELEEKEVHPRELVNDPNDYIVLLTHKNNDEIDGEIMISLEATSNYKYITLTVYDLNDIELGDIDIELERTFEKYQEWEGEIYLVNSPTTEQGRIDILGVDENQVEFRNSIGVTFKKGEIKDKIELLAPLQDQLLIPGNELLVMGHILEGSYEDLSYIIINKIGEIVHEEVLALNGNEFSSVYEIPEMDNWGEDGKLQILSDNKILLEVQLNFDK